MSMEDSSILTDTKQFVGITDDFTAFDANIIMEINRAIFELHQHGVDGSITEVTGVDETWGELYDCPDAKLKSLIVSCAKDFVKLKVQLGFDPPSNSALLESIKNQIQEDEIRMREEVEVYGPKTSV